MLSMFPIKLFLNVFFKVDREISFFSYSVDMLDDVNPIIPIHFFWDANNWEGGSVGRILYPIIFKIKYIKSELRIIDEEKLLQTIL